jgi:type IV pilus assembly protein PilC
MIFKQIGGELPAFTRGFMGVYDFLKDNLIVIIGGIVLFVVSTVFIYTKTKEGHRFFSRFILSIPLFGKIVSQAFITIFCRTMATLLSSGVSVLEVFDIVSGMAVNDVIKDAVVRSKNSVVGGSNISLSLAASGFFPNMVIKMVQVGEETGSLSRVLERTADYYERKVDSTITILMGLMEPIMIITVGSIVLCVVLALYLPIFTMSSMAK